MHQLRCPSISLLGAPVLAAALASAAPAQEAMYTAAATMPSPGVAVLREQYHFLRFGANEADGTERTDRSEWLTSLQVGLARDLSLTADVPVVFERATDATTGLAERDRGVEDLALTFKYRFFKHDTGGIDTLRAAILAGARVASGDDHDFSSQSINPSVGAVVTLVRGRHGFNQDLVYRLNTGGSDDRNVGGGRGLSDAVAHNTAYLFRLWPAEYAADSRGSLYATIELTGLYETNGDYELRWSPGLMFEAPSFAIEVMAQLPLYHRLDHRAELDFSIGVGLRITF
jgi:hypothetical protein